MLSSADRFAAFTSLYMQETMNKEQDILRYPSSVAQSLSIPSDRFRILFTIALRVVFLSTVMSGMDSETTFL